MAHEQHYCRLLFQIINQATDILEQKNPKDLNKILDYHELQLKMPYLQLV